MGKRQIIKNFGNGSDINRKLLSNKREINFSRFYL